MGLELGYDFSVVHLSYFRVGVTVQGGSTDGMTDSEPPILGSIQAPFLEPPVGVGDSAFGL